MIIHANRLSISVIDNSYIEELIFYRIYVKYYQFINTQMSCLSIFIFGVEVPFIDRPYGSSREGLEAANASRITCFTGACSKLGLTDNVRPYTRIAVRVALSYPKAVAQHCIIGLLFHTHPGSDLRLRDYRVVVPEIDHIASRIVTKIVSFCVTVH